MEVPYMVGDIAKITGLSQKTIVDACVRGVITPSYEPGGAGTRRIFSYKQVVQFGLFEILRKWGIIRPEIKRIFEEIDKSGEKDKIYNQQLTPSLAGTELYLIMEPEKGSGERKIICKEMGIDERMEMGRIQSRLLINLTEIKRKIPA